MKYYVKSAGESIADARNFENDDMSCPDAIAAAKHEYNRIGSDCSEGNGYYEDGNTDTIEIMIIANGKESGPYRVSCWLEPVFSIEECDV